MAYQQAPPGYSYAQAGPNQPPPGFDSDHYGRIAEVVGDIANGQQPDVNKLVSIFNSFDTQFWKGALIGAVITVLLTSETVRTALAGTLGGILGAFKQDAGHTDGHSDAETEAT
jgi:hypothetical protein